MEANRIIAKRQTSLIFLNSLKQSNHINKIFCTLYSVRKKDLRELLHDRRWRIFVFNHI